MAKKDAGSTNDRQKGDRIAKVMARAGLCSRRAAETWIADGRVSVNGKTIDSPAINVTDKDRVLVDGKPLGEREATRMWLYHKPAGLVVSEHDPEGRPTIYDAFEEAGLPRVLTVGRLDINTEGLLLLTNEGGLKRVLELPSTGWARRYRVRAYGRITQEKLDELKDGITIDKVHYGPIEATLERQQGSNVWLIMSLREGKNREVKNVLSAFGLEVNRLIRLSYGPFQLNELKPGEIQAVKTRVLKDQLGQKLADAAGVDFEGPIVPVVPKAEKKKAEEKPAQFGRARGRTGEPRKPKDDKRAPRRRFDEAEETPKRRVFFDDGNIGEHVPRARKKDDEDQGPRGKKRFGDKGGKFDRDDRGPKREFNKDRRDDKGSDKKPFEKRDRKEGGRPFGEKKFGDKKAYGDKPRGERGGERKPFGDKPRGGAGRRDDRRPDDRRGAFTDRNKERPERGERSDRGDRKPFGDKPRGKPAGGRGKPRDDRGGQAFSDAGRHKGRPAGEQRGPRGRGGKSGGKPSGGRPSGGKPFGGKPGGRPPRKS
ncbi:pseudouridine synthase [Maritalea mediterranea]|uniref:Pseudouridine synthase n=1 Tax=Maritalea mediterranea TaxID=2909667 RepID=A0ABS9E8N0_9HYPH|nr:pseudouridine synthase [Maritalea mediterranea]MCF4097773.1 pseudouridine synthase [Maritalea mediterranea]